MAGIKPLEVKIENRYVRYAEKRGCLVPKGNPEGRRGYPDRLTLCPEGKFFWIEFKRQGEKPRPLQLSVHRKLRALGHKVYVVDNYEEAVEILESELRS